MSPFQQFLLLSRFEKIRGTGRMDGQTSGVQRLTRPNERSLVP